MDDLTAPITAELYAEPRESDKALSSLITVVAIVLFLCAPVIVIAAYRWAL